MNKSKINVHSCYINNAVWLRVIILGKGKVFPLEARCGPEGG